MTTPNYEVRNEAIEKKLKGIGGQIGEAIEGTGFTFTLFLDESKSGGARFYISSAQREGMVKSMHEFIEREAKKEGMALCPSCDCPSGHWEKNADGVGYKTGA